MPLIAVPFLYFLTALLAPCALADPWPAAASGTNIGAGIGVFNAGFEASGLTYHPDHGYIVVGDDGDIAIVEEGGQVAGYEMLGGDFEGIAVKPGVASFAYIASENLNAILEVSLSGLSLTGKKWPLEIPQSGGLGFEGIAFVPADYAPASWGQSCCGGFFIAGTQADSALRVFDIDTSVGSDTMIYPVATIATDYSDVSGLHFSGETRLLYVLHDTANRLTEMTLLGTKMAQYATPTSAAEEGIVIVPDWSLGTAAASFADDGGPTVIRYSDYPISCDTVSNNAELSPAVLWLLIRGTPES
ncbi:MAG: hypothetical protein L7S57_09390 [Luminiphilus sp.]|nr:hypothetical protein [Luminiphilus sp.]